jgi:hypothetical protein
MVSAACTTVVGYNTGYNTGYTGTVCVELQVSVCLLSSLSLSLSLSLIAACFWHALLLRKVSNPQPCSHTLVAPFAFSLVLFGSLWFVS